MTFTGFYFFCFFAAFLIIYYVCPLGIRPAALLVASVIYYLLSGDVYLIIFPILGCLFTYVGGLYLQRVKGVFITVVSLLLALMISVRLPFFNISGMLIPLGISFYTLSLINYLIAVRKGNTYPERNFGRLLLYTLYFPNILSGPILKYENSAAELYSGHRLSYKNITFGAQRMLWGLFKILVISERCRIISDTIYNDHENYKGLYVLAAAVFYITQLYTNFSGSMDMVMGMSEALGIRMPENFDTPYLAKTIAEYWRRWHITLGAWLRDTLYIPLGGNRRGKLRKHINTLITFAVSGLWHGLGLGFFLWGLLHGSYIVIGELTRKPFERLYDRLNIKKDNRLLNLFRIVRTFLLVSIAFIFFRAENAKIAIVMIRNMLTVRDASLLTGGIFELGLDAIELIILAASLIIMVSVEIYSKKRDVRMVLAKKNIVLRWIVFFMLIFYVILLGNYGPGYSAAEFIYQGF